MKFVFGVVDVNKIFMFVLEQIVSLLTNVAIAFGEGFTVNVYVFGVPGHDCDPLVVAIAVNVIVNGVIPLLVKFENTGMVFVPVVPEKFPIPDCATADQANVTLLVVEVKFTN